MKNIIIILCFPLILIAQKQNEDYSKDLKKIQLNESLMNREIGPQFPYVEIEDPSFYSSIESTIETPYPIIFVHGLIGDWSSWWEFYGGTNFVSTNPSEYGLNDMGWDFGGYFNFCLNSNGNTQSVCNINTDISFVGSFGYQLINADYYIINFDCGFNSDNSNCGTTNSFINDKLSNQAAIILQARALGRAISDVLQITGKEKVILVGHSMGGLAAREYLQNSSHWQGNTHHRVAKLMTSGTPHGGSNASTLLGLGVVSFLNNLWNTVSNSQNEVPDRYSDAVRDLRTSYNISSDEGVLFGTPPMKQNNNYITNYYYNYDVDCDTLIGDYVYGISNSIQYSSSGMRPFPNDLEYSCIVGNNGFASDGVVSTQSANIANHSPLSNSSPNFEIWEISVPPSATGAGHGELVEYDYQNFRAIDEPDNPMYAYKIDVAQLYRGYLTFQGDNRNNSSYDADYYKFTLNQPAEIEINVFNLPSNGVLALFDNNQNTLAFSNISGNGNINPSYILNQGTYYIRIGGGAYGNPANGSTPPYANPYYFSTYVLGCTDPLASNYNAQANIDNNSCCYSASITQNFNSVDCFGGTDGSLTNITVNGGTPPYLFSLNNGNWQINNSFYSLPAGNYTINVKDNNNCTYTLNQTITQPTQIMLNTFVLHPACYGQNYGSAGISNITGGTPPYSYLWNDPQLQTTPNASGLYAGNYKCTVTDANGCIKETPILYINQPQNPLSVNIIHNATTLLANGSGGTPSYSYQWYGPNGFISNANQITPQTNGQYYVVITDVNACTSISESYLITYITSTLNEVLIDGLLIYPNPSKEIFNIQFNSLINQDISLSIYNIIGEEVMKEKLIEFKGDYIKKIDLNKYKKGIYFLEIETDTGMILNKLILQ